MLPVTENTKVCVTLNDEMGLPPTIFTKAYKENVRGMFRFLLRYALKVPELAKRKANIFNMNIKYVCVHGNKGQLHSYDCIYNFIKFSVGITRR